MKQTYTKELLQEAVVNSFSYRETLQKLGLAPKGGNYGILKSRLKNFEIDISHFKGLAWSKGKKFKTPKKKIEELLIKGSCYKSGSPYHCGPLKRALISSGLREEKCENCGIIEWLGGKIIFELHHIDGDKFNNSPENLQILCPNCHSLTTNYRGKNMK